MSKTRDIDLSVSIDAPPEAVWKALTEGEEVAKWFAPEARVKPGVGGSIWLSWGEGMSTEAPIEIFDAPKHLRTRSGNSGETKAPLWVDYTIGTENGTTTLRLVHSGFNVGAEWDDELEAHERGWKIFLANIAHYLGHHRGERVVQRSFVAMVPRDRESVWTTLMSPTGLDRSGELGAMLGGKTYRMALPGGAPLTGRLQIVTPARDFAATIAELGDSLVNISLEKTKSGTMLFGVILAYGDHADQAGPLADRMSAVVAEALA